MLRYEIHSYKEFGCLAGDIEQGMIRIILINNGKEAVDVFFPIDAISYVSNYSNNVSIVLKSQKKATFDYLPTDKSTSDSLLFELRKALALNSKIAITIYAETTL